MNNIKVWPHMTIVAVVCALVAGLGVAFYLKHEQKAQAETFPYAARLQRVDGQVALSDSLSPNVNSDSQYNQWIAATLNQPVSVGDRIYTRDNSRASLAFTGRNFARLNPNTALDVLELTDNRTQLALRDGSAIFDVGYLAPGEYFEVGTPYGAVNFDQPGLYNIGLGNGNAIVSVLSGLAQVVGLGGSGSISKGEMLTLLGTTAAQVILSRLNGNDAGYLVNDYYNYQYPNLYDGRYSNYDAYLNDPYYYDPYRRYVSYQYAPSIIPGLNDLDYYGDWQNLDGYGYAWRPRVDAGWVPYQQGYWTNDYPYGPTWVSSEPWGYAPYHYGRWANIGNQWFWVPDAVNTTPTYAPALVAFLPFTDANQVGWVPLGPGDAYAPRYYDSNWQPYYLTRTDLAPTQLVNLAVPSAVTVVPVDSFGRVIDARSVSRANPQLLTQVRPTLDPLLLTPLRNAVIHSAWGRGKIDLPPGIAKKLSETTVVTGAAPAVPPFGKDIANRMKVQRVDDKVRNQKFNLKDERSGQASTIADDKRRAEIGRQQEETRRQQIKSLAAEAAKGNRDAERQARELEKQQRTARIEQQKLERQAARQAQQAQGERVSKPAQREITRPQPQRAQPQPERRIPQRPVQQAVRPEFQPQPQPQPRHEVKQQPREVYSPPQRAQPVQSAPRAQPAQRAQQPGAPAQKHEDKHGPPASAGQPASPGGGQGKGKGKKP